MLTDYPERREPINPAAFDRRSVARRISEIDISTVPVFADAWEQVIEAAALSIARHNAALTNKAPR